MDEDSTLERLKAGARLHARSARAGVRDPRACLRMMAHFPVELARLDPIAGYWPVGSEMDPRPLMAALAKAGRTIALPRAETREGPLRFLRWEDAALVADAFGAPSPPASAPEIAPRLLLTPLLAFDRAGRRLGQGAGIYDRVLAALKPEGVVAVGLAYGAQEMDVVPAGPLDETLDWVVTDAEAIRCGV